MWLNASCFLEFQIPVPTPFLLMLRPRSGWQQWIAREEYVLSPSVPAVEFTDSFGNLCQRLVAPAGHFSVRTSVDIETADASDTLLGRRLSKCSSCPMKPCRSCIQAGIVNRIVSLKWQRRSHRAGHPATINAMPSSIISATRYVTHLAWTADHQCLRAKSVGKRRMPGHGPFGYRLLPSAINTSSNGSGLP
jgi:hypothetical protein